MADMTKVFDAMMIEDSNMGDSFEDDLFAQEMEDSLLAGQNGNALKQDQSNFLIFCKAMANSVPPPASDLSLLVELQQFIKSREVKYCDRTIFFLMDIAKRATDWTHTTRTGMGEVMCKVTAQKISQIESVVFSMTVPDLGVKTVCVHKRFEPLIYAIFYVTRFQDCMINAIRGDPDAPNSEFKKYFTKLEDSMRYVAYHMPC